MLEMKSKELISEFLKPDDTWEVFGIKNQEDFVEKIVTKGKFHSKVPDKIKKDYLIVERLQFYSYYNYPLIDQAFGKSTRIFEASVDLKIKELGLEKEGFEPLWSKIKKLEKYSSNELHKQWSHAKEIRNLFAHHKAGRILGITLIKAFKHFINMINSVFLEKEDILKRENRVNEIKSKSDHLKKGLYILDYKDQSYLIWSCIPYGAIENMQKSFWVFHPVYAKSKIKELSDFPLPFMFDLENLNITKDGLSATIIDSKEKINLSSTNIIKFENLYKDHLQQMVEIDITLKKMHWTVLENEINKGVVKFIYNYSWN